MAFGRYSIEVDRFPVPPPQPKPQAQPKQADFSTGNPITDFFAKLLPPTEPVAALNYWGSIGSIIGGALAIFQMYEMVSGRKVYKAIEDLQQGLDDMVGVNAVKNTKSRKKKAAQNLTELFK